LQHERRFAAPLQRVAALIGTVWQRLAVDLPVKALDAINPKALSLNDLPAAAEDLMAGKVRGRLLVDVNA
jgi:acrylyl-CoA reductase (NADPH)